MLLVSVGSFLFLSVFAPAPCFLSNHSELLSLVFLVFSYFEGLGKMFSDSHVL